MSEKEYKNIDQLFKSELDLSSQQVPVSVKKNIDQYLDKKKRRKRFFLIVLFLGTLTALSVSYICMNQGKSMATQSPELHQTTSQVREESHALNDPTSKEITTKNIENSGSSFDNQDNVETPTKNNEGTSSHYITNSESGRKNTNHTSSKEGNDENTGSSTNAMANTTKTDNSSQTYIGSNDISIRNNEVISTSTADDADTSLRKEENPENNLSETSGKNSDETSGELVKITTDTIDKDLGNEKQPDQTQLTTNSIDSTNDSSISELVEENLKGDSTVVVDSTVNKLDIDSSLADIEGTAHNINQPPKKYKGLMIGVYGGMKAKRSNLLATDTSENYNNALNDKIGFGIGLDVNYRLKNSLFFGTGLEYASYKENYDYQKSEQVVVDSTVTWNIIVTDSLVDSSGVTYIYDTIQTVNYTYNNQEVYNQQGTNSTTVLHIPFRFGTQFIVNKWRFDAYLQGRYNLILRSAPTYVENNTLITNTYTVSYFDLELGGAAHFNICKNLYLTGIIRYRPPLRSPYYSANIQNKMHYLFLGGGFSINL